MLCTVSAAYVKSMKEEARKPLLSSQWSLDSVLTSDPIWHEWSRTLKGIEPTEGLPRVDVPDDDVAAVGGSDQHLVAVGVHGVDVLGVILVPHAVLHLHVVFQVSEHEHQKLALVSYTNTILH